MLAEQTWELTEQTFWRKGARVSTLMDVYQHLCTDDRFPSADVTDPKRRQQRQRNLKTSLRYLGSAFESTPERLELTPEVEGSYKDRLRASLMAQGKGHSTVRNTIQDIGQFLRAYHELPRAVPIPQGIRRSPRMRAVRQAMVADSPYAHLSWMRQSPYYLPTEAWPEDIRARFKTFRERQRDRNRRVTVEGREHYLRAYLGYLRLTGEERLNHLPPEARAKLALKGYCDDVEAITAAPSTLRWNDLFVVSHLQSFVIWHAWRTHTAKDAQVRERPPSKPSAMAKAVGETVLRLAQVFERTRDIKLIADYLRRLPEPRRVHNKQAPYHQFQSAELEEVALTLIGEARQMVIQNRMTHKWKHPGAWPASRFALGLVLMLGWRIPMRLRNWTEALLETNLRKVNGAWHWHFEGDELKVGERNGETNVFDMEIPAEVVPYLEEYLTVWRPRLPHAATDRHILLSRQEHPGGMLRPQALTNKVKLHVYRLTGKRLYPHLLRTLFVSHAIRNGLDPTSAAFVMNDKVATILPFYNEFYAEEHQKAAQDFYRRALKSGNGHTLPPPAIPAMPSAPRLPRVSDQQLDLL
jgi:hypothetical protein